MNGIADWIYAAGSILSGVGIIAGVVVARSQLNIWRHQSLAQRRADAAINLISAAHEAGFALNAVRQAMETFPEEAENREVAVLEQKYQRLRGFAPEFDSLRKQQALAKALFDSKDIEKAIADIFSVRQKIWAAMATLSGNSDSEVPDGDIRRFYSGLRRSLYRTNSENDLLSKIQDTALKTLEEKLIPYIQLKGAKK